jgi:hypothetical protein
MECKLPSFCLPQIRNENDLLSNPARRHPPYAADLRAALKGKLPCCSLIALENCRAVFVRLNKLLSLVSLTSQLSSSGQPNASVERPQSFAELRD